MLDLLWHEVSRTLLDLLPIFIILGFFSARFLSGNLLLLRRSLAGLLYLAVGLTLFRTGLDGALLPFAGAVATGLTARFAASADFVDALALVSFVAALGSTAALIEPTLVATAHRVSDLTGGSVKPLVLRLAVAAGFGLGLAVGGVRLVLGFPIGLMLAPMIGAVIVLAILAPRQLVPLALDSGAIATSVVTVPMIAAYGVAVADALPARRALTDGFGLLVMAMLGSALAVLATATLDAFQRQRLSRTPRKEGAT